jgi:DNA-binding NarL/FixJ family response regulator
MAKSYQNRSDFTETYAIHSALRFALSRNHFGKGDPIRRNAEKLVSALESDKTIFGRQLRMLEMMRKGVTIEGMCRRLHCSRRTVFRYLNHLESAGVEISLENGEYTVADNSLRGRVA